MSLSSRIHSLTCIVNAVLKEQSPQAPNLVGWELRTFISIHATLTWPYFQDLNASRQILMTLWVSSLFLPDCGGILRVVAFSKLPAHLHTGNWGKSWKQDLLCNQNIRITSETWPCYLPLIIDFLCIQSKLDG